MKSPPEPPLENTVDTENTKEPEVRKKSVKKKLWDLITGPVAEETIEPPKDIQERPTETPSSDVKSPWNKYPCLTCLTHSSEPVCSNGLRYRRQHTVSEEEIFPEYITPLGAGVDIDVVDIVPQKGKDVAEYCLPLIVIHFCGQTSLLNDKVKVL